MQVSEDIFDSCDLTTDPLVVWGDPSVDNSATISHLVPGSYYFMCAVSGHCDAGMKLNVIVLPNDGLPIIANPMEASCSLNICAFTYNVLNDTPRLNTISVSDACELQTHHQ